jgi:predicted ATP-grasp superfamily ATP-dependent carboligase
MRLFVYEYCCSGALAGQPLAQPLRREGWTMLQSLLADLSGCPGVQLITMVDQASARDPAGEAALFTHLASQADAALVIAPEFTGLLYDRCRWVEEVGVRLLGPGSATIQQVTDKLALGRLWEQARVRTPSIWSEASEPSRRFPLVVKPRWGAGSQVTFLVQDEEELDQAVLLAGQAGWKSPLIFQEYAPGRPVSVALLIGPGQKHTLPACWQHLSTDGRYRYLGGSLPLPTSLDERARRLALQAVQPVPGLHGYVGVDLLLGDAQDGADDVAIEINPRLTTSYVGLRALTRDNLAAALLAVIGGEPLPALRWTPGPVHFAADGSVA